MRLPGDTDSAGTCQNWAGAISGVFGPAEACGAVSAPGDAPLPLARDADQISVATTLSVSDIDPDVDVPASTSSDIVTVPDLDASDTFLLNRTVWVKVGQTRVSENDVYIWPLKGTYFVFLPGKICRVKRVPISGTAQ